MVTAVKLLSIPEEKYYDYRLDVIFDGYKWDPQVSDNEAIARHVLVLSENEHKELVCLTEKLDKETVLAERMLCRNLKLTGPLKLPGKIRRELKNISSYQPGDHIRLMRYDFHPVRGGGWKISEVNSDVPGGLAEASLMPEIAAKLFDNGLYRSINLGDTIVAAADKKIKPGGTIVFIHCTSYSDDRQVMQFLGDRLKKSGFNTVYAAADHLRFEDNEAICVLDGSCGKADAIFRFTPIEWLVNIKPKRWQGYFNTVTASCNHPVAIFAQTKRFPFVWDLLEKHDIRMTVWRELLPETLDVKDAEEKAGFIFKPVYGRVGERISIKEACRDDEYDKILKDVKRNPKKYLLQRKFDSNPLTDENGKSFHVCLGSYTVEGAAAGYYARLSKTPRIDFDAADIPVLIERENS